MSKDIYSFINLSTLDDDKLLEILSYRNRPEIRMRMANTEEISAQDHLRYCHNLAHNPTVRYYLIQKNGNDCGVLTVGDIDWDKKSFMIGLYLITEDDQVNNQVPILALSIYKQLGLTEIKSYVKKDNIRAMVLNTLKLGAEIVSEDDVYYYMVFTELNKYLRSEPSSFDGVIERIHNSIKLNIVEKQGLSAQAIA